MDKPTEYPVSEQPQEPALGRRELLKALAAGGAAVTAASLLPGQWVKPVVEAGLLPAHAQTSAIIIRNLKAVGFFIGVAEVDVQQLGVEASFDYEDGLCQIDENARLFVVTDPGGVPAANSGKTLAEWDVDLVGDSCSGTIFFFFDAPFEATSLTVYITAGGRSSNTLTAPIEEEPGE